MPPKKKAAGKKPAADVPEVSLDELREDVVQLRNELDKERKDKNHFQLERDKIHTTLEVTERELRRIKVELKNADKEMEEDELRHQAQLEMYMQKETYLLHEQRKAIAKLRADFSLATEQRQREQKQLETELKNEMKATMKRVKADHERIIKELDQKHKEKMIIAQNRFEEQRVEIRVADEIKLQLKEMEPTRIKELNDLNEQWKGHIAALIEDHNNALRAIMGSIRDTQPTLDSCKSLKANIEEMNTTLKHKNNVKKSLLDNNKSLAERLSSVKGKIVEQENKVKIMKSIHSDVCLKFKEKQLNDRKREYEALKQKFMKLQAERDELFKSLPQKTEEIKQKANLKIALLETKLKAMEQSGESNVFSVTIPPALNKFEVLDHLKSEIVNVCKASIRK
uniref:Dynein regulatory complex subunit 4 n=1 Tax=Cynoglossus semilaevis TaxID=244447 RepID=A0A3P8URM1_CYNSE